MTQSIKTGTISLLIVDDSLVFRRFIRDIFDDCHDIKIVAEAQNGIKALDMVLKHKPDVILLDFEMPIMDGMTALQHLMIHRPTPTIMFSSLTDEGTARCFDTMKNGAIDFICKNFIFHESHQLTHKKLLIEKVRKAALLRIIPKDPVFSKPRMIAELANEERVIFCEDCGHRQVMYLKPSKKSEPIICSNCGDEIDTDISSQKHFRRNTFLTVICGGEGSFFNLLEIIPQLEPEIGGALIVVLHGSVEHINSFAEYLDAVSAMKVIRARDGTTVEGGHCYIASASDFIGLKPYSAQLMLQKVAEVETGFGPIDTLLSSVCAVYKSRMVTVVLSGDEKDGDKGVACVIQNGGTPVVLDSDQCYFKKMGENVIQNCQLDGTFSSTDIVEKIRTSHYQAKGDGIAGYEQQ